MLGFGLVRLFLLEFLHSDKCEKVSQVIDTHLIPVYKYGITYRENWILVLVRFYIYRLSCGQ